MSTTSRLAEKYRRLLESRAARRETGTVQTVSVERRSVLPSIKNVGIVGGGMAGLYSALLLKTKGCTVKIFEASERLGGRVYTHRFSDEKNQYFEAGAMRLPVLDWQMPVFNLIAYLNENLPDFQIETIPYHYSCPTGNRVYVNNTKSKDGKIMSVDYANKHPDELGFPDDAGATVEASKLLHDAIEPVLEELGENFEAALEKYDSMTLHYYLSKTLGWSESKINYVEVMTSQTNEFRNGLVDQAILNADFLPGKTQWRTIKDGMSRLPEAVGMVIGKDNIHLRSRVDGLEYCPDGRVQLEYTSERKGPHYEVFDCVILALPPSAIRMMPRRPRPPEWPVALEHGLRSIHFQPLYKIGMRFKSRFWERPDIQPGPSLGGQSTTDLPCRWVVYPSYGLGDKGEGVLLQYSWMTDSSHWLPQSQQDKVELALQGLRELYPDVTIADEDLLDSFPVEWAVRWPLGDAIFYAGQFSSLWALMSKPQRNVHFAGEHLSMYHFWIAGALDSAMEVVSQIVRMGNQDAEVEYLKPKKPINLENL